MNGQSPYSPPHTQFSLDASPKVDALYAKNSLRQNALHFPKYRSTLLEQGETPALLEKLKRFSPLLSIAMGPPHTRGLMCLYHEFALMNSARDISASPKGDSPSGALCRTVSLSFAS